MIRIMEEIRGGAVTRETKFAATQSAMRGTARFLLVGCTANFSAFATRLFDTQIAFLLDTLGPVEMLVSCSIQRIACQSTRHLKRTPQIRFSYPISVQNIPHTVGPLDSFAVKVS